MITMNDPSDTAQIILYMRRGLPPTNTKYGMVLNKKSQPGINVTL